MLPAPRVQVQFERNMWQELIKELSTFEKHTVNLLEVRSVVTEPNEQCRHTLVV